MVDEDPTVTLNIRLRMNTLGYQVQTEHDAVPAMNQAIYDSPDILVFDVNQSDGIRLAAAPEHINPASSHVYPHTHINNSHRKPHARYRSTALNARTFMETLLSSARLPERC